MKKTDEKRKKGKWDIIWWRMSPLLATTAVISLAMPQSSNSLDNLKDLIKNCDYAFDFQPNIQDIYTKINTLNDLDLSPEDITITQPSNGKAIVEVKDVFLYDGIEYGGKVTITYHLRTSININTLITQRNLGEVVFYVTPSKRDIRDLTTSKNTSIPADMWNYVEIDLTNASNQEATIKVIENKPGQVNGGKYTGSVVVYWTEVEPQNRSCQNLS